MCLLLPLLVVFLAHDPNGPHGSGRAAFPPTTGVVADAGDALRLGSLRKRHMPTAAPVRPVRCAVPFLL